jgi:hypothetical protein
MSCPQIVLARYLAVTSFDGSSLVPNEDEVIAGRESRGGIAYSPKIESVEKLPHDLYDEWYLFESPRDLGNLFQGNVFETSMQAGQVAGWVWWWRMMAATARREAKEATGADAGGGAGATKGWRCGRRRGKAAPGRRWVRRHYKSSRISLNFA